MRRRLVTCYGLNVVLTLLAIETFFNHGVQTHGFKVVRSGGYVEGVGT